MKKKEPTETFSFKTANGNVTVTRTATVATIIAERTCFGFTEKEITEVQKMDNSCMHLAFFPKNQLIEILKSL